MSYLCVLFAVLLGVAVLPRRPSDLAESADAFRALWATARAWMAR